MRKLTIAIDGPPGSGGSRLGREVAAGLAYRDVDSGAMYRALGWKALAKAGAGLPSEEELERLARDPRIELEPVPPELRDATIHNRVLLDGKDVTQAI